MRILERMNETDEMNLKVSHAQVQCLRAALSAYEHKVLARPNLAVTADELATERRTVAGLQRMLAEVTAARDCDLVASLVADGVA